MHNCGYAGDIHNSGDTDIMELQIGQKRKFSFSEKTYRIREILDNPGVTMQWTWTTGICPYCKRKIERIIDHIFYKIEILGDDSKEDKDLKKKDIVLMGDTLDRRRMILTADKYVEVLSKSKILKHLAGE